MATKIGHRTNDEDNEILAMIYSLRTRLRSRADGSEAYAEAAECADALDELVRKEIDGPRTFEQEPAIVTKIRAGAA